MVWCGDSSVGPLSFYRRAAGTVTGVVVTEILLFFLTVYSDGGSSNLDLFITFHTDNFYRYDLCWTRYFVYMIEESGVLFLPSCHLCLFL